MGSRLVGRCGVRARRPYAERVRNGRVGLAVLAVSAAALLSGCAKTVSGHGEAAGPAPSVTVCGNCSTGPSGTGLPNLPLPSGEGNPDPEIPDSPCDVLDKNKLKQQFGEDALIERKLDSCKITSHEGDFLSLNTYASLTLTFERTSEPGGRNLTVAGLPAYIVQNDHYLIISRSKNPNDRGIMTCYVGFAYSGQLTGLQIATQLLEQIMPHYQY
jgi:hypothetical protein